MQLVLSPLAQTDLEAIGDYIALDSPGNALRFIQGLRDQCQKMTRAPLIGSKPIKFERFKQLEVLMRNRIAMTLVATCARSTWARGRFCINFGCQQRLAVFGVGFQYARASARRGRRQAEAFWTLTPITAGSLAAGAV